MKKQKKNFHIGDRVKITRAGLDEGHKASTPLAESDYNPARYIGHTGRVVRVDTDEGAPGAVGWSDEHPFITVRLDKRVTVGAEDTFKQRKGGGYTAARKYVRTRTDGFWPEELEKIDG